jgi:hypothetical protein
MGEEREQDASRGRGHQTQGMIDKTSGPLGQPSTQVSSEERIHPQHSSRNHQPPSARVELTIEAARLCGAPATIMNVAGVEVKSKIELLDMLSEALVMDYNIEKSEKEDLAWVGNVGLMCSSLGKPKVKLREGIERMIKQRYGKA